ncbi:MAG: hypothetical protein PWQ96_928 [Clostridia bacterium]|jgi:AmmeMemoRadiSam system protein A|nr:hypothetical protein [Clostridiales bacterium]MDK2985286.1 hypothetical protein [Clostridia bacterium]
MGEIVFAGFVPHPPLIVKEIGGREIEKVKKTVNAIEEWAESLASQEPDVLIFITPHATVFQDAIGINMEPELKGSFASFGAPGVKFHKKNDLSLASAIRNKALQKDITIASIDSDLAREYRIETALDHGTMVPLYYIEKKGVDFPLVVISMGFLTFKELYSFGIALKDAVQESDLKVGIVASGDLSHRLTPDAPAGYDEKGKEFDEKIAAYLKNNSFLDILELDNGLIERAGECGLRPLIMLLGALDGCNVRTSVLSYEGPFGVGYLVARFDITGEAASLFEKYLQDRKNKIQKIRESESLPVQIARKSLEKYLREGKYLEAPEDLPEELRERAGAFVSIKKEGSLRGCIGTIQATQPNVCEEIIHNAVSAGVRDPRFNPVEPEELSELEFSVDILMPAEPIDSMAELDPKRYGVIVRKGGRSGLLLPDLEGIDTAEEQVNIALKKAGISPHEDYRMERFLVKRYR